MSNIKHKTGILGLVILIVIISIYTLLPQILTYVITKSLQNAGLQIEELTVAEVATDHIEIPHTRFIAANGTMIDFERLSIKYSISQLISGTAESISVQQVDVHLTDKKSDPVETLSTLHHLLGGDFSELVPFTSVTINSLELYDAQGESLLQAVAILKSDKKTLKLEMKMQLQSGETRNLHIIQQQPGQWNLQAVDPNGSKLLDASFRQAQEFPLKAELNASLKQLKPWSLLFGFPLPEYQVTTQASIQLKPDYKKKTIQFKLDAKSRDIREPAITLQSATATLSGEAAMREEGKIELTTHTDFSMDGFKRGNLSADAFQVDFDAQLLLTNEGIQGNFSPGLNIETHGLKLLDSQIKYASLQSISKQPFNWHADSGMWQFENNSLRVKKADVLIGNTLKLTEGLFDLNHTAWRYPLMGTTSFELTGTARSVQQNGLQLADNKVQLSGDITWKTAENPASVSADIQLAAKRLKRNSLSANNVLFTGKTQLVFNQNTIHTSLDKASRLTLNKATLEATQIGSLQISPLDQLNMEWNSMEKSFEIMANQLEFLHTSVNSEQVTINPGTLVFSFDNWNQIKQLKLTGTLSNNSIKIVSSRQPLELKKTAANFTINWPIFTLSGQSSLQLTNSRIDFDLSHDVLSKRGVATLKSNTQEITSTTKNLKRTIQNWPPKLRLLGGTTSFSGHAKWENTDISARATLKLNNIDGRYNEIHFSDLDSSIDLDLLPTLRGKSNFFRVKSIDNGMLNRPSTTFSFDEWDDIITPEVVTLILGDSIKTTPIERNLELKNTDARLTINWPILTLSGKSVFQPTNSSINFDLSHNVVSGHGSATAKSDTQGIALATRTLKRTTPDWPIELHLVSGTTNFSGKAKWQNSDISSATTIKLNNIGGRYGETYFSGLNSNIDLDLLPAFKGKSRSFHIDLIDIGIPISELSTTLAITKTNPQKKPIVILRNSKAKLLSGSISGNKIRLDLNQHSNDFTLAFKGVDIAELVKLHQFEGLNAIGKLSGTIPIRLEPEGTSISNGKASAVKPGGSISYIPDDSGNALKNTSPETELMFDVLRDFQYNTMEVTGEYKPDGQLQVKLGIKGKSPQYDKNRPVHLNLNLDQNILSLLKSVRTINGLNERLDRAVQKHYKSQQR